MSLSRKKSQNNQNSLPPWSTRSIEERLLHTRMHVLAHSNSMTTGFELLAAISPNAEYETAVGWGTCALRHRGRRGRESRCKACLGACLGGIAFCGQFLCFAFQSFRHRSAVFLDKVLQKSEVLVLVLVHVSCH